MLRDAHSRRPGFDALRVGAMVAVVFTHAGMSYMVNPPRIEQWPVHDPPGMALFDLAFLYVRTGVIGVFFALSGFFAAESCARVSPGEFLKSRWKRIGVPLVVSAFLVLPAMYLVWCWAAWLRGYIKPEQILSYRLSTADKTALMGPAHLWFLEYLMLYAAAFAVWRWAVPARRLAATAAGEAWVIAAGACATAAGLAVCVAMDPAFVTEFRNDFTPRLWFFGYNGLVFAAGAGLWRYRAGLEVVGRWWWAAVLLAQGVFAWWMWVAPGEWAWVGLLAGAPVFTVLMVLGWMGGAGNGWRVVSGKPEEGGVGKWLAGAGYGVYVVHLPIVWAAQIVMQRVEWPTVVKWLVAGSVGLAGAAGLVWGWGKWQMANSK
ncbi:hypothetical protein PHYC_00975 [Phycisphaerales bacterium]|nr:hypothetical protein PHYC_00975 [Phycisphaerales bacterium]